MNKTLGLLLFHYIVTNRLINLTVIIRYGVCWRQSQTSQMQAISRNPDLKRTVRLEMTASQRLLDITVSDMVINCLLKKVSS